MEDKQQASCIPICIPISRLDLSLLIYKECYGHPRALRFEKDPR